MRVQIAAGVLLGFVAMPALAQLKKQFVVENREDCNRVYVSLKAKTGTSFIRPSQYQDLLSIYSNQNAEDYGHSFSNEMRNGQCDIRLALLQASERGVGQKLSYKVFGSGEEKPSEKVWKVYFTENKTYSLDFDYGLGSANIDLSGLSVRRLNLVTGSADVQISYASGTPNKIEMDTFAVRVDLGSLTARHLAHARAKTILLDVGFGNMTLDFSQKLTTLPHVRGSVGAGNLVVLLPDEDTPVLVKVRDSWLCTLNLGKNLKKIGPNTYANAAYTPQSRQVAVFDLDVSMGKILFRDRTP